jgi:hypothetical protein
MDNYYKSRYLKYKVKYNSLLVQYGALKRKSFFFTKKSDLKYTLLSRPLYGSLDYYPLSEEFVNVSSSELKKNMEEMRTKELQDLENDLNTNGFVKTIYKYTAVEVQQIDPIVASYDTKRIPREYFWKEVKDIIKKEYEIPKENLQCKITSLDSYNERYKRKGIKKCKDIYHSNSQVLIEEIYNKLYNRYNKEVEAIRK